MFFRISTERKNTDAVAEIVAQHFTGFTLIEGTGYYEREPELSLIIEIETTDLQRVIQLAVEIASFNDQEAVLVQQIPTRSWFVGQKQHASHV